MDDVARADLVVPVKRRAHCTKRALREAHDLQLIASPVNLVLLILRQQGEFEAEVVEGHLGSVHRCVEGALELDGASALELDAAACELVETSALARRRLPCPRIFFFSPLEFYSLFFLIFRPTP